MAFTFQYSRKTDGNLIPKIPITIQYRSKKIKVNALLDTGADVTFIPEDIAETLGIKHHRMREFMVTGIDKELKCTLNHVDIILYDGFNNMVIKNVPVHIPKFSQKRVGVLLGRNGFLDKFEVTLNEKENVISLKYLE